MKIREYMKPAIMDIGFFADVTRGVPFGKCRDIFGGRAFVCIG